MTKEKLLEMVSTADKIIRSGYNFAEDGGLTVLQNDALRQLECIKNDIMIGKTSSFLELEIAVENSDINYFVDMEGIRNETKGES